MDEFDDFSISRITVLLIGVEGYQYMRRLYGSKKDVDRFEEILSRDSSTGLFSHNQVNKLVDPDSSTLRSWISDYTINRSAERDILIIYFSGHGVPVGHSDFGFCTIDSRIHNNTGSILPLSLIKLIDILDTLRIMNVTPIIFIDACYSGIAGDALLIPPNDMTNTVRSLVMSRNSSNYAVFCACTDRQFASENSGGGLFSQLLISVLSDGFATTKGKRKPYLTIREIYCLVRDRIDMISFCSTPQLFVGDTLQDIPIVRNPKYKPLEYQFSGYLETIILGLWNNGDERELSRKEILDLYGRGAYGNHSKLSLSGWDLVEDNPVTKKRRLTERGRKFALCELTIPSIIVYDTETEEYVPAHHAKPITLGEL